MSAKENLGRDAKFELEFRPEQVVRFEPDHPQSPAVGFVYGEADRVRLIVLEHSVVTHDKLRDSDGKYRAVQLNGPVQLIYTPPEWVAFYMGIKDDEFKDFLDNPDGIVLRDSKDPDGTILVVSADGFRAFTDAIKSGKYDLTPAQHEMVMQYLMTPRQE